MGQGVPARDEHLLNVAGVEIGAAELDRADARAVLDGQVLDHLPGQRHGHPLRRVVLSQAGSVTGHLRLRGHQSRCRTPAAQPALSPGPGEVPSSSERSGQ